MKTEKEIKRRLVQIKVNKSGAKFRNSDQAYISNCKLEKLLKWILEKE